MRPKHFFLLIIILLFNFIISSNAQIKFAKLNNNSVYQYEKAEWDIQLIAQWKNPYFMEDVSLDMELVSPSGKEIQVPCFFLTGESGGLSTWKARFSPIEQGKYTCKFRLCQNKILKQELISTPFEVFHGDKKGFLHGFDNYTFIYDNGEHFRGLGEDICWEARSTDDSKFFKTLNENPRFNYEYMFRKLSSNGGNFTRVWISPWNFPIEWKQVSSTTNRYTNSNEYFNPSAIKKLDRLFELSDSLGIYIMLTFSGTGGFEESNYYIKKGGFAVSDSDFFVNPQSKQQYKNKLRYFIARWGYSPSIGAWELYNEVNWWAFSKDTSNHIRPKSVVAWHDEMSTYLRDNDPYRHLITTSIAQTEVEGLNSVKNIDFNQIHVYSNIIGLFEIPGLINNHIARFNKPYVIGEFAHESDWLKNFDLFEGDMDSDFKRGLWLGLFSPTPVLPMSWWWEYFENRGMMSYFKNVREIMDEMMISGKGSFAPVNVKSSASDVAMAVQCGSTTFIYLYNSSNEDKTGNIEVINRKMPGEIQLYDCETRKYNSLKLYKSQDNNLNISGITIPSHSDKVIIVK